MDFFQSVVLALIQGVSAWIPVSSKTQVILAADVLFGIPFRTAVAFALSLHVGDFLAALYRYRAEYRDALSHLSRPATYSTKVHDVTDSRFLILSILFTSVLALPLYLLVRKHLGGQSGEGLLFFIGLSLLAMAAITFFSHRKSAEKPLDVTTTILAGLAQALAVIPGISRSGITQCTLLLCGIRQDKAMRLSFLMSAPMILAAVVAFFLVEGFGGLDLGAVLLGIGVSALASFLTMDALTKIARRVPAWQFMAAIGLLALVPFVLMTLKVPTG